MRAWNTIPMYIRKALTLECFRELLNKFLALNDSFDAITPQSPESILYYYKEIVGWIFLL